MQSEWRTIAILSYILHCVQYMSIETCLSRYFLYLFTKYTIMSYEMT